MIIAMAGLPGSGKSTLALELAANLPAVVLNKDTIRAALFRPDEIEYSQSQDDFVVDILLQVAEYYFRKDPSRTIILDGRTFSRKSQVDTLVEYCLVHQRELRFIYCICSDRIAKMRIERDAAGGNHLASDRNFDLYLRLQAQAEPLQVPHLTVDTGEPLDLCVQECLAYLSDHSNTTMRKYDE